MAEEHFGVADLLFSNTSDGVLLLGSDGKLSRLNPAAAAMLRCTPEMVLGKPPEAAFATLPALTAVLCNRAAVVERVALPDNRLAICTMLDTGNGEWLALLQDVTEREALDSRREQLVLRIAHDLRNPIAAILGFAELIPMYGTITPDQQRFVTRILQSTHKLRDIVNPLVDLTWVEAGMPMDNIPVRLDQLIRDAVDEVTEAAHAKQISIAISAQQPMPAVKGDPGRLRQVIRNIVQNAIMYSESEKPVVIHAYAADGQVICSVADRGYGIVDDEVSKVFDRLYRIPDERVRSQPGGGIGLTMARAVIQRHGGTIHAESVFGEGSTFTFTLPLA